MGVCLTRQPIFDSQHKVFAYELLFRSGFHNFYDQMGALIRGKLAFVNFTGDMLKKGVPTILPKDSLAIELPKNVTQDSEVLGACIKLKRLGYPFVLEISGLLSNSKGLLELSDFIKVDFIKTNPNEKQLIPQKIGSNKIKCLAYNVDTGKAFYDARKMGYCYFQGYFFAKPAVISGRDIAPNKMTYLRLLQELNQPDMDSASIEKIIKQDTVLSYKLLSYINSAFFGLSNEIKSIKHAIALMGVREAKKWASLIALSIIGKDKTEELLVSSLTRAKFYELIAPRIGLKNEVSELFLMGLFSLIDALTDQPMAEVLGKLPISVDIKNTLLGEQSRFQEVLCLVMSYEKGEWGKVSASVAKLKLVEEELPNLFLQATEWSNEILSSVLDDSSYAMEEIASAKTPRNDSGNYRFCQSLPCVPPQRPEAATPFKISITSV